MGEPQARADARFRVRQPALIDHAKTRRDGLRIAQQLLAQNLIDDFVIRQRELLLVGVRLHVAETTGRGFGVEAVLARNPVGFGIEQAVERRPVVFRERNGHFGIRGARRAVDVLAQQPETFGVVGVVRLQPAERGLARHRRIHALPFLFAMRGAAHRIVGRGEGRLGLFVAVRIVV